ncbi:fibronectin type III domain-containing protein [Flagellimonas sp. DF-77]|uniref:fibronectin type III domain-containing protein n=1 Tax=Flagellimonas algarum TaxID=3230298 RepID=UPI003390ECCD
MRKSYCLLLLLLSLWPLTLVKAQNDVMVVTQVLPPYSPYFSDYTSYDNRVVVTLNNLNPAGLSQEVRLTASATGNNGIALALNPSFLPSQPILIPPGGSVRLTGFQLQEYFDLNAWDLSGISAAALLRGGGLPQGDYELCVQALDYTTGQPLSMAAPNGCGFFTISSVEPPLILQPLCGDEVSKSDPQNLLFSWAIPAGANPMQVEYELVIQEVFNGMDPNQLFLALPTTPFFQKRVTNNVYLYTLADPPLEPGRTYAFRVTAVNRQGFVDANGNDRPLNFRNGGSSEVCTFQYGQVPKTETPIVIADGSPQETPVEITVLHIPGDDVKVNNQGQNSPPDPDDALDCIAPCTVPLPQNQNPVSNLAPGDEVAIGKFSMQITNAQFSQGGFTGDGTIFINFLDIPIHVEFTDLKVNTDLTVYQGQANAVLDGGLPPQAAFLTQAVDVPAVSQEVFQNAMAFIDDQGQKIHLLEQGGQAVGMPLLWEVGPSRLTLLGMVFSATGAHINMASGLELPDALNDQVLLLTGSNCLRPNGFGNTGEMLLAEDVVVPLGVNIDHTFAEGTGLQYDCSGIQGIDLNGQLEFDRNLLLPLSGNGTVIDGTVTASYETQVENMQDWSIQIEAFNHPFTLPGLVGFQMEAQNIVFDQSLSQSPPETDRPASWTGLYLGDFVVTFPDFFKKNGEPIEKTVQNFILDKNGVSGTIGPFDNLISIEEGDVSSWPISVTGFTVEIQENLLQGSEIFGNIRLPITDTALGYTLLLSSAEDPEAYLDLVCEIDLEDDLQVPMWMATLDLFEGSSVTLKKTEGVWTPRAALHGTIEVAWGEDQDLGEDNAVSAFTLPKVEFQDFTVEPGLGNVPKVDIGSFGLTDAQANIAGFTFALNQLEFDGGEQNKLGITLDIGVKLLDEVNSIEGDSKFTIWGEYDNKTFGFDYVELQEINLGTKENPIDLGVAALHGGVKIFKKDEVYGNGFKGAIGVRLNAIEFGFDALMQLGSITEGDEDYRYWYFDMNADIPGTGIPIPPTIFSIFGGGGGAWYNMSKPEVVAPISIAELKNAQVLDEAALEAKPPGFTRHASDQRTPEKGTYGLSQSIVLGINSAETVFNADLNFDIQIETGGSFVPTLSMGGKGYLVQSLDNRDGAFITGDVDLTIVADPEDPKFSNTSTFNIDILDGMVDGSGTLDIYVDKNQWHHKFGFWSQEDYPWEDETRVQLNLGDFSGLGTDQNDGPLQANVNSYFMLGSDIPGIPKMPLDVRNFMDQPVASERGQVFAATFNEGQLQGGSNPGLALGGGIHVATDMDFLIFYMRSKFLAGFDLALRKEPGLCEGGGINGFYAKGNAYAYFLGDAGVNLDLWVWKGALNFMKVETGATLTAGLPNPVFFDGKLKVNGEVLDGLLQFDLDFKVELGEECQKGQGSPFDEFPIIADVIPADGEDKVSILTIPEVAFNFPEEVFEFSEINKKGKEVTRKFQYELDYFTLEWLEGDKKAVEELASFKKYRPDGYSATFNREDYILPEETSIAYKIGVTAYEWVDGEKIEVLKETKTGSFVTDRLPDKIKKEHIWLSTPFIGENYFIPSYHSNQGMLTLMAAFDHWDDPDYWFSEVFEMGDSYKGMADGAFAFIAQFTDVKSKTVFTSTFEVDNVGAKGDKGGGIAFAIPQGLQPNRGYELELIVKYTPPINKFALPSNTDVVYQEMLLGASGKSAPKQEGLGYQTMQVNAGQIDQIEPKVMQMSLAGGQGNGIKTMQWAGGQQQGKSGVSMKGSKILANVANTPPNPIFEASLADLNNGDQNVSIRGRQRKLLNPEIGGKAFEWKLFEGFKFQFKTSTYSTLASKLASIQYESTKVGSYPSDLPGVGTDEPEYLDSNLPIIVLSAGENFDQRTVLGQRHMETIGQGEEATELSWTVSPMIVIDEKPLFNDFVQKWGATFSPNLWGQGQGLKKVYHVPNANDWAKLEADGAFYQNLEYGYPSDDHWQLVLPDMQGNASWSADRYLEDSRYAPFHERYYPNVYELIAAENEPATITWHAGSYAYEPIQHQGATVGFTTKPYTHGGGANGGLWLANNQFQNNDQLPDETGVFFALVDYTEWLAMRDWHRLRTHIYEANENLGYGAVQNDYGSTLEFNRARQGLGYWIQNLHRYSSFSRAGGSPQFTLKSSKGGGQKKLTYNIPPNMNTP